MDYQQYPYSEVMQLPVYMESSSIDGMIDPILKPSTSPWTPPQIHRYLTENNKPSLFGYTVTDPGFSDTIVRRDSSLGPPPRCLPQRRHSPSFSHTSSTSSSILSPPGEGDYYQPHSPPTPTDGPIVSSFFSQFESASSRAHLYQFTGLAEDCVKPIDINPFQESPESYFDDNNPRSEIPQRGYSMSTDDSGACMDMCSGREQIEVPQPISPPEFALDVKEEIQVPEDVGSYPAFGSDGDLASSDEAETPNLKREDEDDDEYKPYQKQKRARPGVGRHTRNRKRQSSSGPTSETKRPKIDPSESGMIPRPAAKPVIQGAKASFPCPECPKRVCFKDDSSLQNHIKKQHTRPFVCVFGFAGCTSTFASKNEWKRHCSSQHLVLNYWICQQDQCAKASSKPATSVRNRPGHACSSTAHSLGLPRGTIFNRKDLYTQHLRRMHIPANFKKQVKQRKPAPEWEACERKHQEKAKRTRCNLPTHMQCPAFGCTVCFEGANAWDDRMEHVAKHLEKAVTGLERPIQFGGEHDRTLMDWATRADIAIIEKDAKGKWKLRNPLKSGGGLGVDTAVDQDEDEDAEGEEVDE